MISSYLNEIQRYGGNDAFDAVLSGPNGEVILVEVKHTSNVRDARDAMLQLAYELVKQPHVPAQAVCILAQSKFTASRVVEEIARFREVVRSELGERVHLAAIDEAGQFVGKLPMDNPKLREDIQTLVAREQGRAGGRVSRQAVKAMMVDMWVNAKGPQTIGDLQKLSGASYPTVSAALAELKAAQTLVTDASKRVAVVQPPWPSMRKLAEDQAAERKVIRYTDPSGHARSPREMAKRLTELWKKDKVRDVALGGVLGAMRYDTDLNVTAALRLDLNLYSMDTSFVRHLDAGLVETHDPQAKAVLVLHRPPPPKGRIDRFRDVARAVDEVPAAPALDCLADLLEIGLVSEAQDFAAALPFHIMDTHGSKQA